MPSSVFTPLEIELEELEAEARDRFYPDWWMFSDPHAPAGARPAYQVICRTEEERQLAYRVRPPYVDATIVLEPFPASV